MKKILNSETVNLNFSSHIIENTFLTVNNVFSYDRRQPYQTYSYAAIIRVSHIEKYGTKLMLLRRDDNGKLIRDKCPCNLNSIPQELLDNAVKRKKVFVNVLAERKLFSHDPEKITTGKIIEEVKIIIPSDQKRLGYFSNNTLLTKKVLLFLNNTYNDRENLSLRRKMLLQLHVLALYLHQLSEVLQITTVQRKKAA